MIAYRNTGVLLLFKAVFICLALSLISIDSVEAKLGFDCAKGKAPNASGQCVTCGYKDQPSCEPARKGPQCFDYLEKINGYCRSRGGQGDLPYSGVGFDCKPGYNVGDNGRCTRCGGNNQPVCEKMRGGKQCKDGLKRYKGECGRWGQLNQAPWPKGRPGFPCDKGLVTDKENNKCVPCGGLDQRMCRATRKGPQCRNYLGEVDGWCRKRGGEGELTYEGAGFDCKPGFNKNPDDKSRCTACGGNDQPPCEPMRKGKICNDGLTLSKAVNGRCQLPPYRVEDPFKVYNRSGQEVFVSVHWILPEGDFWTMETATIAAGGSKAFTIAGKLKCYPEKHNQHDANVNPLSGLFNEETDSCKGQHFQVLFWDSQGKFNQYAAEMSLIPIMTAIAWDQTVGKISKGLMPASGAEQVAELTADLWRSIRDPEGTMAGWGVHDWAMNLPQASAWVAYWGKGTKSDVVLDEADYVGNPVTIAHPSQRTPRPHTWFLVTNAQGQLAQTNQVCGEDTCPNANYTRRRTAALAMSASAATTDVVRTPSSSSPSLNALGLWDFEVNGKLLTDEFIEQTGAYVVLQRYGTTQKRRYEKVGDNEYRNKRGSTFRFVSNNRGIWISPDKKTVYQLKKR